MPVYNCSLAGNMIPVCFTIGVQVPSLYIPLQVGTVLLGVYFEVSYMAVYSSQPFLLA